MNLADTLAYVRRSGILEEHVLGGLDSFVASASTVPDHDLVGLVASVKAAAAQHYDTAERDTEGVAMLKSLSDLVKALRAELGSRPDLAEVARGLLAEIADDDTDEATNEPEPIAAAARPAMPSLQQLAARRPSAFAPRATVPAVPKVTDWRAQPLGDLDAIAAAFVDRATSAARQNPNGRQLIQVARIEREFPEDRVLDDGAGRNETLVAAARAGVESLVASGGQCGPATPYYEQMMVSDASRPVRDSLTQFGATRGSVTLMPPPRLSDILVNEAGAYAAKAVTIHSNTNDVSGVAKGVQVVACGTAETHTVDAISSILQFGNIASQTFPERMTANVSLTMAQHARTAERVLLTAIGAGSTHVNTASVLGGSRDILGAISQGAAAMRNRHRMAPGEMLSGIFPSWLRELIRSDVTRTFGYEAGPGADQFGVTDQQIDGWIRLRGVSPTWSVDGEVIGGQEAQMFPAQVPGGLYDFPAEAVWYLFPSGSWLFLDGGTLDLGIVRDSVLNASNNLELFSESWETTAFVGVESLRVTSQVCASGLSAGTKDTSTSCSGYSFGS